MSDTKKPPSMLVLTPPPMRETSRLPVSDLLQKVKAFLPELSKANEELEALPEPAGDLVEIHEESDASLDSDDSDSESEEEEEEQTEKKTVEMTVGFVPLDILDALLPDEEGQEAAVASPSKKLVTTIPPEENE